MVIHRQFFLAAIRVCHSFLLTISSYPFLLILFGVFFMYRNIINILLKLKLGEKYGGLLLTNDALFCLKDKSYYSSIMSMLIIKHEKPTDVLNKVRKTVATKIFDCSNNYPKLTSTMRKFGGYYYLFKNSCYLSECVHKMDQPTNAAFNEEHLKEELGKINNKSFPQNNEAMWEMIVSENPLEVNPRENCYRYPIIIRVHHAVGNGTSVIGLMMKVLGNCDASNYSDQVFGETAVENGTYDFLNVSLAKITKLISTAVFILFFGVGRIMQLNAKFKSDTIKLYRAVPCGEKFVAWVTENKMKFLPIVKKIKNRVPSTKFTEVILTAVTKTLVDWYKRNFQLVPDSIPVMVPVLLDKPTVDLSKPIKLENNNSAAFLQLRSSETDSLIDTLRGISAEEFRYEDIITTVIIAKYLGILPVEIIRKIFEWGQPTCLITNVPGCSQVRTVDDSIIEDIIPLAPNTYGSGISFTFLTYDNRLQLGVLVDKAIVQSQDEAQRLADDVFSNLQLLDVESRNKYK